MEQKDKELKRCLIENSSFTHSDVGCFMEIDLTDEEIATCNKIFNELNKFAYSDYAPMIYIYKPEEYKIRKTYFRTSDNAFINRDSLCE